MSDNGGMMLVMISMMILSSCVSSSLSSGLFVAANEDWLTGQMFDWMDTTWWTDFKGWFGFSTAAPTTAAPGGETTTAAPAGGESDPGKYKSNCVYAYTGKDAKSGYVKSMCVDDTNPQKIWSISRGRDPVPLSFRVGKEVKVNLIPFDHTKSSYKINGRDVNKPVNTSSINGFNPAKDEFQAVSTSYKFYDVKGNLSHVGNARDEKTMYLYADTNGQAYIGELGSKTSGEVSKSDVIVKNTSSVRIGKNVEAFLSDGKTSRRIKGQGTKNVINLSQVSLNDKLVEVRTRRV